MKYCILLFQISHTQKFIYGSPKNKFLVPPLPLSSLTQNLFSSALGFCVNLFIFFIFKKLKPIIVFNIYFFLIFTLLQPFSLSYHFIFPLPLQSFSLFYIFISPLPSTLISFFIFPCIFLYFCLFLFTPSYYKFVTISSILCIVFPHKKMVLSLSLNFLVDFFFLASLLQIDNFLYSLKLYFGLMQFSFVF